MKNTASMMKRNTSSSKKKKSAQRSKSTAYVTPIIGLGTIAEGYVKQFADMESKLTELKTQRENKQKNEENAFKNKSAAEQSAVSELRKENNAKVKDLRTKLADKLKKIDTDKIFQNNKIDLDLEKEINAVKLEKANLANSKKNYTAEYESEISKINAKNKDDIKNCNDYLSEQERVTASKAEEIKKVLEETKQIFQDKFEKKKGKLREEIMDLQAKYFLDIKNGKSVLENKIASLSKRENDDIEKEQAKLNNLKIKIDNLKIQIEDGKKKKDKDDLQKLKENLKQLSANYSAMEKETNAFIKESKSGTAAQIESLKKKWADEEQKLRESLIISVNALNTKIEEQKYEMEYKEFKYCIDKEIAENKISAMTFIDEQFRKTRMAEVEKEFALEKEKITKDFNIKNRENDLSEFDADAKEKKAKAEADYAKKINTSENQYAKKEANYLFNTEHKKANFEINKASISAKQNISCLEQDMKKNISLMRVNSFKFLDDSNLKNFEAICAFKQERFNQAAAVFKDKIEEYLSAYEKRFEVLIKYHLQEANEAVRAEQYIFDQKAIIIKEDIAAAEKDGDTDLADALNRELEKLTQILNDRIAEIKSVHEEISGYYNGFLAAEKERCERDLQNFAKLGEDVQAKLESLSSSAKSGREAAAEFQTEYENVLSANIEKVKQNIISESDNELDEETKEYAQVCAEYDDEKEKFTAEYEESKNNALSDKNVLFEELEKERTLLTEKTDKENSEDEHNIVKLEAQYDAIIKSSNGAIEQKEKESAANEKTLKDKSEKEVNAAKKAMESKIKNLPKIEKKKLAVLLKKAEIEQDKDWWEVLEF